MTYAPGSLVKTRGREWVVLPGSEADFLLLRPLGGMEDETTGVCTAIEEVAPASFDLPDPKDVGDHRSCRLLRDAVRISSRASAGPFRSFARIAVEPRPYQLVPLLMALRLDPVRLLIADDVGIGKTVEAALIARELLDRGEIQRLAVLCPPHLAEQWQRELTRKFHVDVELVLSGSAARLERQCRVGESLFERYPFVIVSTDFIKSDTRRQEFLRSCPEFVIVDEAHTCAFGQEGRGGRHQRHQLVTALAKDPRRHIVLVTATPHSGNEEAFRSLLSFLDEDFSNLPPDLSGKKNEHHRRKVAAHLVQRRRADIRHYLDTDTPFPEREEREDHYKLSPAYRKLFDKVIAYARENVIDESGGRHRQRVRWWSALALLRSLASSPAAAAATLMNRAATAATTTEEEADEIGRKTVLDPDVTDLDSTLDVVPGADPGEDAEPSGQGRDRRLVELAREAEALTGAADAKLKRATEQVRELLAEGFSPIVFCRFIPTADYVAEHFRSALPRGVEVQSVTGTLPPEDREMRITQLGEQRAAGKQIVLVCTDCLSEGINLQDHFDAVLHYDLAWNPTRHEQREGRVDRYGQPSKVVRVLTYYGVDNQIDGIVLDVLLRKHQKIRSSLGISVPVPVDTTHVVQAVMEGMLLRDRGGETGVLPGLEAALAPRTKSLLDAWETAAEREKQSRTMFAQHSIHVDEVRQELDDARRSAGSTAVVRSFTLETLQAFGALIRHGNGLCDINLDHVPRSLRDSLQLSESMKARFELPIKEGEVYLSRTHPAVEGLAAHVLDTALDPLRQNRIARRAGAIRTKAVQKRTTLLICRFRFDITTTRQDQQERQIAEETGLAAFAGAPAQAEWFDEPTCEALLIAEPGGNILPEQAAEFTGRVVDGFGSLQAQLDGEARRRAGLLLEAHQRVRRAARIKGVSYRVEARLPADVLGIYVFLPV